MADKKIGHGGGRGECGRGEGTYPNRRIVKERVRLRCKNSQTEEAKIIGRYRNRESLDRHIEMKIG